MKIDVTALAAIEQSQGIPTKDLFAAIAQELGRTYREAYPLEDNCRVRALIDESTGDVSILLTERDEDGEIIDERDVTPDDFDRIAASAVRTVLIDMLRDAERQRVFSEYRELEGTVISGVVQRDARANKRGIVVVQLGTEADCQDGQLLPSEQIPGEKLQHGDRIKCYVTSVSRTPRAVQINLSRTHPDLLRKLFELEVPEVADGIVEIVEVAREAGHRSKIAVRSHNPEVSAKGACIGPHGQRVTNVTSEFEKEMVDIISYSDDPVEFVSKALAPATVITAEEIEPGSRRIRAVVPEYKLSLAIGREGQNVRLAARLTQCKIDIVSDTEYAAAKQAEAATPQAVEE